MYQELILIFVNNVHKHAYNSFYRHVPRHKAQLKFIKMQINIDKLSARKDVGKIGGSGETLDER